MATTTKRLLLRAKARVADDTGFTLIEVMLVIGILAIATMGFVLAQWSSVRTDTSSQHDETALTVARDKIEELRSVPFSDLDPATGKYHNTGFDVEGLGTVAGDPDGMVGLIQITEPRAGLYQVTVILEWRGVADDETYQLTTLISGY